MRWNRNPRIGYRDQGSGVSDQGLDAVEPQPTHRLGGLKDYWMLDNRMTE